MNDDNLRSELADMERAQFSMQAGYDVEAAQQFGPSLGWFYWAHSDNYDSACQKMYDLRADNPHILSWRVTKVIEEVRGKQWS